MEDAIYGRQKHRHFQMRLSPDNSSNLAHGPQFALLLFVYDQIFAFSSAASHFPKSTKAKTTSYQETEKHDKQF